MGRYSTFSTTFNELKNFTLADLKRLGFMISWRSGEIRWTCRGETTGTIGVTVNLNGLKPGNYIELEYRINKNPMKYRIDLIQLPSNLGRGLVWYFICPLTGERCRTLYEVGNYFASRKALKGTLYESQTHSKHYRWLDQVYGPSFKVDTAYDELYKPYTKKHYRGKPTPKARKAMKWSKAAEIQEAKGFRF